MTITLYLEVNGRYKTKLEVKYEFKELVSGMWHRMYAGKRVNVYYVLESKLNFQNQERPKELPAEQKTA